MMRTRQKKLTTLGLIQALILVVLLNLSGHIFVHLGDSLWQAEETHLSATHEEKSSLPAQHFCSVCQDHQHLSLDTPAPAATFIAAAPLLPTRIDDVSHSSQATQFKPTRAPPRN